MPKDNGLTQQNFTLLLQWLDPDASKAAHEYERIRRGLIRIFKGRGCHEAEDLADRTFDRVCAKLNDLVETYDGDPTPYFYGVARKLHQEWSRKAFVNVELPQSIVISAFDSDDKFACLEHCLNELPTESKELILNYYLDTGNGKIAHRRSLANEIGVRITVLQVRTSRIRRLLGKCLKKCMSVKKS